MIITSSYLEQHVEDTSVESIPILKSELNKHKTLIRLMKQLKHQYFQHDYKMMQLAHQSALSERQLFRFFKLNLQMTPSKFVQRYRLEKSLNYLSSGITLGDVSFNVGFSSQSYFCRCFKECFGESPKSLTLKSWQNINKGLEKNLLN